MNFNADEVRQYLNAINYQYVGSEHSAILKGLCPNPAHNDRNVGSFVIWANGGACKCYSCGWTGDFVKFIQTYTGRNFRETLEFLSRSDFAKMSSIEFKQKTVYQEKEKTVNAPSGFPFPGRDFDIAGFPYLVSRGYSEEYKKEFGLYYCDRASYKVCNPETGQEETKWLYDYMVLPIGKLWEARDISRIQKDKPKVQYPKYSSINSTIFNLDKLDRREPLYLTEGAGSHPKLWAHISKNSSFVFGSKLSVDQVKILQEFDSIIWIPDNDEAGLSLVFQVKGNLANSKILDIPFDDSEDDYVSCIQSSVPIEPMKYLIRKYKLLYG